MRADPRATIADILPAMATPEVFRWEHRIPVRRELLWDYVADTERLNRLAGLFPVRYTYKPLDSGGSEIHAEASSGGITLRWIERPCEWVEHEYFRFTRDYQAGPFLRLVSEVTLADGDAPDTTDLVHTITVTPRHLFGRLVARVAIGIQTRAGFRRVYELAPRWAAGRALPEPGGVRPRDTAGGQLDRVLRPLAARLGLTAIGEALRLHLLEAPASELGSLAPYALADRWKTPRRDTLRLFLHATNAGLFDLEYELICPSCRRAKASASRLAELAESSHCPTCNIRFGVDFDRAVEVRFAPRPLGLGEEEGEYCHAGPRNTPHRIAGWNLEPGASRAVKAELGPGKHQLLAPQAAVGVYFDVVDDPDAPSAIEVELGREAITGAPPRVRAGALALTITNAAGIAAELMIARAAWADDVVSAAELATIQDFRDLFSAEILAPGTELAIQNQVFLFTDVVGSTALYERIGDGSAFALVRQHFDTLRACYVDHEGALVKTIGDAIMAVFRRPVDGLRAAIAMQRAIADVRHPATGERLKLRIGLHRGPCIAMTANDRIDYFGTTVNTAARIESKAGADEIAVSAAILADAAARGLAADERLPARTEVLELKGLRGTHAVTVFTVDVAATTSAD